MRLSWRSAGNERGAALILVLWVSAAAAVLAMGFLDWARADASLNRNAEAAIQARLASEGALAAAAYEMASGKLALEQGRAELTVTLDGVEVQATVQGESGMIDLNKARQDLLEGLAEAAGVDRKAARLAAKAITAWRDVPKSKTQGKVLQPKLLGDRLASRLDHGFDHVNELRLVPGLDPTVVSKLAPWLTVYSGSDQVDADLAPATVKEAVSIAAGLRALSGSSNAGPAGSPGGAIGQLSTLPSATAGMPKDTSPGTTAGASGTTLAGPSTPSALSAPPTAIGAAGTNGATTAFGASGFGRGSEAGATTGELGTDGPTRKPRVAGTTDPKNLYRLTLVARSTGGLVTRHTVVIWLDGRPDRPYRILDWSPPELASKEIG